jgi:hypothetical protein
VTEVANTEAGKLEQQVDHQQRIGYWQTAILFVTALVTLLGPIYTGYIDGKRRAFEAEIHANQTWENYRRLEIEFVEKYGSEFEDFAKDPAKRVLYTLWVERLLIAADAVTISLEGDPQWRDAFTYEFVRHREFILSDEFLLPVDEGMSSYCTYRTGVRVWLRHAFRADEKASKALAESEAQCLATLEREGFRE